MYCVIRITDRNVDYMKEFNSYEEAYALMKKEFLEDIKDCFYADGNYDENSMNYQIALWKEWAAIVGDDFAIDWYIKEFRIEEQVYPLCYSLNPKNNA